MEEVKMINLKKILSLICIFIFLLPMSIPAVEKLFRVMSQKALVAWQRRLIRNNSQTAKERYVYFINNYPDIASKINDKQIASYLGISHEFLSKIKRRN